MHEGEVCNDCGKGYDDVYWIDDEMWSLLHERAPAGMLCPTCLVRRALLCGALYAMNGENLAPDLASEIGI